MFSSEKKLLIHVGLKGMDKMGKLIFIRSLKAHRRTKPLRARKNVIKVFI
jgi:hypothetical protein